MILISKPVLHYFYNNLPFTGEIQIVHISEISRWIIFLLEKSKLNRYIHREKTQRISLSITKPKMHHKHNGTTPYYRKENLYEITL